MSEDDEERATDSPEPPEPEEVPAPEEPVAETEGDPIDLGIDEIETVDGEEVEDPFDRLESDAEVVNPEREASSAGPDDSVGGESGAGDDPFTALGDVDEALAEEAFERMEVDELGEEEVWTALAEEDVEIGGEATPVGDAEAPDHVVDKRQYCQRCPHFSEPPNVACHYEGSEIVEVMDSDEFRVRGCPMVTDEGPKFDRGGSVENGSD